MVKGSTEEEENVEGHGALALVEAIKVKNKKDIRKYPLFHLQQCRPVAICYFGNNRD